MGKYSSAVGATNSSTCMDCTVGNYCANQGTIIPAICPSGYFCPVGTSDYSLKPCPVGSYSNTPGLSLSSQCNTCSRGHYCLGSSSPISCDPGKYNPKTGGNASARYQLTFHIVDPLILICLL